MRSTWTLIRLFALTACFVVTLLASAFGRPLTIAERIKRLAGGPPAMMGTLLPPSSYVRLKAKRLAHAKIVWVNWDLLRELGIPVENGMTPELEKALLDAFAWGVPGDGEPGDAFIDSDETEFYADRYGGRGIGKNLGSGRAASRGRFQIKGFGKTSLVSEDEDHSNGTLPLEEGIREAIWDAINRRLPFGSNRVLLVIDRGTNTDQPDGPHIRNGMVVRVDPVRPAHFIEATWGSGPLLKSDKARTAAAIEFLLSALPVPEEMKDGPLQAQLSAGLSVYTERVARQYAAAYAMKIYHGGTSPSNITISGQFLDAGTETALPDHGDFIWPTEDSPSGDITEVRQDLIIEFIEALKKSAPEIVKKALPQKKELLAIFDKTYESALNEEFLKLTGVPLPLLPELLKSETGRNLASLLRKIAKIGSVKADGMLYVPRYLTRFNLNQILVTLAAHMNLTAGSLDRLLAEKAMPARRWSGDRAIRGKLIRAYGAFFTEALSLARSHGMEEKTLAMAMETNAVARNRESPDLFTWQLRLQNAALIKKYEKTGDPRIITEYINGMIEKNNRPFSGAALEQSCLADLMNL